MPSRILFYEKIVKGERKNKYTAIPQISIHGNLFADSLAFLDSLG